MDHLLLESGDHLLLETSGDFLILELTRVDDSRGAYLRGQDSAPPDALVNIRHETGDTSEYFDVTDSRVTVVEPGLAGSGHKLSILIDDGDWYVYARAHFDKGDATELRVRLYFDPNSLTCDPSDRLSFFRLIPQYVTDNLVNLYYDDSDELTIYFYPEAGGTHYYSTAISDEPHLIEFYIRRSKTDSSYDGYFEWWIDGVSQSSKSDCIAYTAFNLAGRIDVGNIYHADSSYRGTFYIDEIYVTTSNSEIGPVNFIPAYTHGQSTTQTSSTSAYLRGQAHAPPEFIIDIDLEEGNLSDFTSTTTPGDISVTSDAALGGSKYGLAIRVDDSTFVLGFYDLEAADTTGEFRVRFYFDTNTLNFPSVGNAAYIFGLQNSSPSYVLAAHFRYEDGTNFELWLTVYDESSDTFIIHNVTPGEHILEFSLFRASTSTSHDGGIRVWLDGSYLGGITNRSNYDKFNDLKTLRIGEWNRSSGVTGTIYFDQIVVSRYSPEIGPVNFKRAYTRGVDTTESSAHAYSYGGIGALSSIDAYLLGNVATSDSADAYTRGLDAASSSASAYLVGQDATSDSVSAFLSGVGEWLYPDGDIATGSWKREDESPTNLYVSIDEALADDDDYVYQTGITGGEYFDVSLSDPTSGNVGEGDVTIFWRGKRLGGVSTITMRVQLWQWETALIAQSTEVFSDSDVTYTYKLTSGEKSAITNWTALKLRFIVVSVT